MRRFKQQRDGGHVDLDTGRTIPDDLRNRHRRELDRLVAAGRAVVLAPDPAPRSGAKQRRIAEYASKLPVYDVIEALLEAETGSRTKLDALLVDFAAIRIRHPGA